MKCKKCGSSDFYLLESLAWKCFTNEDDDGVLHCHNKGNEIEDIICEDCDTSHEVEDFKDINFN